MARSSTVRQEREEGSCGVWHSMLSGIYNTFSCVRQYVHSRLEGHVGLCDGVCRLHLFP